MQPHDSNKLNALAEYAYSMKVTEKCDVYSYGVVLLELVTGKPPIQPLEQGGDLVAWVRNHIHAHSFSLDILDARLDFSDQINVDQIFHVLKIAVLCTHLSPSARPTMRQVVSMLIGSVILPTQDANALGLSSVMAQ